MADDREPDDLPADEPAAKFFLAVYQSNWSEARLYRCYPDPTGVSFLYTGPAIAFLDPEVARGGKKGTKTRAADALRTGAKRFAAGAAVVGLLLAAIALRLVLRGKADPGDFVGLLVMLGVMVPTVFLGMMVVTLRKIVRRTAELDVMSPDERAEEAARDKKSFRVTADNTGGARIGPDDTVGGRRLKAAALLSFRHDPTGKWKLSLPAKKDAKAAAKALSRLLGREAVEVTIPVGKD
jgi:hypothetical protein